MAIDIAVVFNKISTEEALAFKKRIMAELNDKIDLQIFNLLPLKIKKNIAKKHRILYRSPTFDNIKFTSKHLFEFNDYSHRLAKI